MDLGGLGQVLVTTAVTLLGVWFGARLTARGEDRRFERERRERLDQMLRDKLDGLHDRLSELRFEVRGDAEAGCAYAMRDGTGGWPVEYLPSRFGVMDEVFKLVDLYAPTLIEPCKALVDALAGYQRAREPIALESKEGSPRGDDVRALRAAADVVAKAIGDLRNALAGEMRRTLLADGASLGGPR